LESESTKKVIRNNVRGADNARNGDEKLTNPQETTITIKGNYCAKDCRFLNNIMNLGVTYGCNLCIEEVGPSLRRLPRCLKVFGK